MRKGPPVGGRGLVGTLDWQASRRTEVLAQWGHGSTSPVGTKEYKNPTFVCFVG